MRLNAVFAAALSVGCLSGLSACATNGARLPAARLPAYDETLQTLENTCRDRGGVLVASGATTGRAETDNYCKITGGATRLPRS